MRFNFARKDISILMILYSFSFFLQSFYIDIGFALKPYMIMSAFVFMYIIFKYKKLQLPIFKFHEILLLIVFTYFIISVLWATDIESSLRLMMGIIIFLICLIVFRTLIQNKYIKSTTVKKSLAISFLMFNVISIIMYLLGLKLLKLDLNDITVNGVKILGVMVERYTPRLIGTTNDPNIFVLFNVLPHFFFFQFYKQGNLYKVGFILTCISIFLSLSRGGILMIVLTHIFKMIINFNVKNLIKIVSICVVFILLLFSNKTTSEIILNRISGIEAGSGRTEIWRSALHMLNENPILGIGIYNFRYYNKVYFNDEHYAHNTLLEVFVEGGVIGGLLFIIFISSLLIFSYKKIKKYPANNYEFMSLIACCGIAFFLSTIIFEGYILLLALLTGYNMKKDSIII